MRSSMGNIMLFCLLVGFFNCCEAKYCWNGQDRLQDRFGFEENCSDDIQCYNHVSIPSKIKEVGKDSSESAGLMCDCCADKNILYHTIEAFGFMVETSGEKVETAHMVLQYDKDFYLHVFVPEYVARKFKYAKITSKRVNNTFVVMGGNSFEIIFDESAKKLITNNKGTAFWVEDVNGKIVKPIKVVIKDQEICIGDVRLYYVDDIDVTVEGREVYGLEEVGFVIPEILIEELRQDQIDKFFYKLVNEKISEAIRFLEDTGFDPKPFLMAAVMG